MIPQEHLSKVCLEYNLGKSLDVKEVLEGALNHNYILETSLGKYFIKSVREKKKEQLQYVYDVEVYMKSKGILAVVMLKTQEDKISLELDGDVYTVYEYVESDRSHAYSLDEYFKMGKLLAEIHLVGNIPVPEMFQERKFKVLSRPLAIQRFETWKAEILAKENQADIDTLFLQYMDLKLEMIADLSESVLPLNNTLIHGDFHMGNLLISKDTREIIGVCDWEQSIMAPRAYELARSLMYICFDSGFDVKTATEKSNVLMHGYNSVLPISIDELKDGFSMRLERTLTASWIEEGYYQHGDDRGNRFISHEIDLINLFIKNKFDIGKLYATAN